jgi:phage antirepressor YoqD-like protein
MYEVTKQGDRRMTVREVAEVLGVTDEAIKKHIRELYPDLMKERVTTLLDEKQITEIKRRMRLTTKVASAITDIEAAEMLLKSAEHFKARFEQERRLRENAESRLAITEPKAEVLDKITATDSDISVRELAAVLAIPHLGQNNFYKKIRDDGYIDRFNHPYRQHVESGLMYEKEYYVPQLDETKTQLRITQKGVAYFARKYGVKKAV